MLEDFIKEGLVRKTSPDIGLAKSLIRMSKLRFENIKNIKITGKNSFSIIENSYEAVKELIDALMSINGYKSYSHEASITFLKEFTKIEAYIINKIDRYRKIRNNIKYRGEITTKEDAENAKKDMKIAFAALLKLINTEMNK